MRELWELRIDGGRLVEHIIIPLDDGEERKANAECYLLDRLRSVYCPRREIGRLVITRDVEPV